MAVKAPGEARVAFERGGVGNGFERDAGAAEGWICRPEATGSAEVRQPGIDAHAGPGGDEQAVGGPQPRCSPCQVGCGVKCYGRRQKKAKIKNFLPGYSLSLVLVRTSG